MSNEQGYRLAGLLLERPSKEIEREDLLSCKDIKYNRELGVTKWEEYSFVSQRAFLGEDPNEEPPPYVYKVVCRRSGPRLLMLSHNRDIIEHLVDFRLGVLMNPKLRRLPVALQVLATEMTKRPTFYALSFVHARVPAFGSSLRAVSFYGDDLGESALFKRDLDLMNCYVCGLRRTTGGSEILRIGSDGAISFYMNSVQSLKEVEDILRFLRKEGYLPTPILTE